MHGFIWDNSMRLDHPDEFSFVSNMPVIKHNVKYIPSNLFCFMLLPLPVFIVCVRLVHWAIF